MRLTSIFARSILLVGLAASGSVSAATNFDGDYAVDATTDEGDCARTASAKVKITDGQITAISADDVSINGLVASEGLVSFVLKRGAEVAHAAGHMKGKAGSGTWSSNTNYCGGRWRAHRID